MLHELLARQALRDVALNCYRFEGVWGRYETGEGGKGFGECLSCECDFEAFVARATPELDAVVRAEVARGHVKAKITLDVVLARGHGGETKRFALAHGLARGRASGLTCKTARGPASSAER